MRAVKGTKAECPTPKPSRLVSVEPCQGKVCLSRGERAVWLLTHLLDSTRFALLDMSPDISVCTAHLGGMVLLYVPTGGATAKGTCVARHLTHATHGVPHHVVRLWKQGGRRGGLRYGSTAVWATTAVK